MVLPSLFINYKYDKYKNEFTNKHVIKCYNLPSVINEDFFQFFIKKYNNEELYKIDKIIKPSYEETKLYPWKIICNKNLANFLIKKEKILVVDDTIENNKVYIKFDNHKNEYNNKDDPSCNNDINMEDKKESIKNVSFENNMFIDKEIKTKKNEEEKDVNNNMFSDMKDNCDISFRDDNNETAWNYININVDKSVNDKNFMMNQGKDQSIEGDINKYKKEIQYCEYVDEEKNKDTHNNNNNNNNNDDDDNIFDNIYDYYSCHYSDQFIESDSDYSITCDHNNIITYQESYSYKHSYQKYNNKNIKDIDNENNDTCDCDSNTSETKSGYSSYKNNVTNYRNNQENKKKCKKIFYIYFIEGNAQDIIEDIKEEDKNKIDENIIEKILNEEKEYINKKKYVTNDTCNINDINNSVEDYIYNLHNKNSSQCNDKYINSYEMETNQNKQELKSDISLSTCCIQNEEDIKNEKDEKNKNCEYLDEKSKNCEYEDEKSKNYENEDEKSKNCEYEDEKSKNCEYEDEKRKNCEYEDEKSKNCEYEDDKNKIIEQNNKNVESFLDDNEENNLIYSSKKSSYSSRNIKEYDIKITWPNKLSWKEISNEIKQKLCVVIKNKPAEWNHYDLQNFLVSQFHNKNYIPTFQDIFITKSCPTIATVAFKNEEERNYFLDHQKFKLPPFKHYHNDLNKNNIYYNKYSNFLVLQEYVISYNTQSNNNHKKYYQDKYEQHTYNHYDSKHKRKYNNNYYDHYNQNLNSKKYSDVSINKYRKKINYNNNNNYYHINTNTKRKSLSTSYERNDDC